MRFPNKITPYNESVFPVMIKVLSELGNESLKPLELYKKCKCDISPYSEALDCLFALGKIDFDDGGRKLHRVD